MANLSKADLDAITQGIGSMIADVLDKKLSHSVAVTEARDALNPVNEDTEYDSAVSQKLDEVEARLIGQLENPVHKIIRARNVATMIDVTAESIAQLLDLRKTRSKWKTQTKIR